MTHNALNISDAAGLAIHAVTYIARQESRAPVKLARLARVLDASLAHLGKVMHRLAQSGAVASKRGPAGGFTLGPRATEMTLLDVYEIFDGPLGESACVLGVQRCTFGACILGKVAENTNQELRRQLGGLRLSDLGPG